jgi:hypothetical protein
MERVAPERVAKELAEPLQQATEEIAREVAARYQPGLWESLPEVVRQQLIRRVSRDAPQVIESIMTEIRDDVEEVLDLKNMIVTNLIRDKALLNRIFREAGGGGVQVHRPLRQLLRLRDRCGAGGGVGGHAFAAGVAAVRPALQGGGGEVRRPDRQGDPDPAQPVRGSAHRPLSDRVFAMVFRHVQRMVDAQSGLAKPLVVFAVGGTRYQEMKREVASS